MFCIIAGWEYEEFEINKRNNVWFVFGRVFSDTSPFGLINDLHCVLARLLIIRLLELRVAIFQINIYEWCLVSESLLLNYNICCWYCWFICRLVYESLALRVLKTSIYIVRRNTFSHPTQTLHITEIQRVVYVTNLSIGSWCICSFWPTSGHLWEPLVP